METLNEVLTRSARILADRPFIVSDAETLTYGEFAAQTARAANVLSDLGIGKGDPVGLYLPSCPVLAVGYFACQRLGAIPTPMSAMYRETEVGNISARTEMKAMLTTPQGLDVVTAVRAATGFPRHILVVGGTGDGPGVIPFEPAMAAAPATFNNVVCGPADSAALFFTSGTTGAPKGALHTQLSQYSTLKDMMTYNRFRFGTEVFLDVLPIFNNFGATCKMNLALFSGATMIMQERWDTQRVLKTIRDHKVTFMAGTPTMFLYMINEFDPAVDDLSSLRLAVTGGAPVAPAIMEQFEAKFGVRLVQAYGSTEVTGYITGEPLIGPRRFGSAGLPFGSAEITIVDDDGNSLPANEIGEIRVGGDTVGGGYWLDPETTAKIFTDKGWLSGDLGYLDADGFLFIVDRKKDVIISGGYNIYPLEVEDLIYGYPDVGVCALVGVSDPVKGEIPAAVIVVRPGTTVSPDGLIDFCRSKVAAYKVPRQVYFIDEMPLGPNGKILKRQLRDWIAAGRITPAETAAAPRKAMS
ncbi:acyl-CoA synthetase (AMP-forming)/AMP-acid ligase II [Rhodoligotrophos appendicifer]|uniref:class I adenylate-forming enzyme family protein n=1 Tax=Rhodoligotrophos appendicifer TaxID=987056 RepID=UPI0011864BFD|nr:AMP-binding protein [Rhodoligotrophos appendicifer]